MNSFQLEPTATTTVRNQGFIYDILQTSVASFGYCSHQLDAAHANGLS